MLRSFCLNLSCGELPIAPDEPEIFRSHPIHHLMSARASEAIDIGHQEDFKLDF